MPSNVPFFERVGARVLTMLVGPIDRIPQLYERGRLHFAVTRGGAYAMVMFIALVVTTAISGGKIFDQQTLLRIGAYTLTQFLLGLVLAMVIWRMVERIAQLRKTKMKTGPQT
ncbi:MAG: hypothetical protein M3Y64_01180 [Gemmatimonadota bacterium]|nr:hypothetical protein [Gemmatimonadota bacterium]